MRIRTAFALAIIGGAGCISLVNAQTNEADVSALMRRLQELEQKVQGLEQKVARYEKPAVALAATNETPALAPKSAVRDLPTLSIGATGLVATSADTNFSFGLRGLLQIDSRTFSGENTAGNDSFLLRRARPIFVGTVFHDFDFMFNPDFGGSTVQIFDAFLNYRYAPWFQVRAGKFKTPVGLEYLQSDQVTAFNERALPTALMPGRDIGFQLWGEVAGGAVIYSIGIFNGVGDGRNSGNSDFEDHREVAARLFAIPFNNTGVKALRGLGFGFGGSWGDYSATNSTGLPNGNGYITDGQQQFFAYNPATGAVIGEGEHWRLSPQGYYYFGPFGLLGEYVMSTETVRRNVAPFESARLDHTGWQVTASWVLTGEDASFTGVMPKNAFDPRNGKWGAWQLVGRYAELDVDDNTFPLFANPLNSASKAQAWSAGMNWYLNRNVMLKASYSRTTFSGAGTPGPTAPASVTQQPEEVFFTRMQLSF